LGQSRPIKAAGANVRYGSESATQGEITECAIAPKADVHFVWAFPTPTLSKKSYNRYDRSEARSALGFIEEV